MYYNADFILILTSKGMSQGCFLGVSVDRGEFECTLLVIFFLLTARSVVLSSCWCWQLGFHSDLKTVRSF